MKKISLTGDRPTGKLHLGHYAGSLITRLQIQDEYQSYILIADTQAMTDNYTKGAEIRSNVIELMKDYLSVGLGKSIFALQSNISSLYEFSCLLMNYISLNKIMHNPTVKTEIKIKGKEQNLGFVIYPVFQAADILGFNANVIPVGKDQIPIIEDTNDIVNKVNDLYNKKIFDKVSPLLSNTQKLMGIDGKHKASKSLNNAIFLSDSDKEIQKKVRSMYTDSNHIKVTDSGKIEGNVVFEYLSAFGSNQDKVSELKADYKKGGLADSIIKQYLIEEIIKFVTPIRERRELLSNSYILERLDENTKICKKLVLDNLINFKKSINFI